MFNLGGILMNRVVTSKEEILQASRELLKEQGWTAINIRAVAAACHVSVGSIYNYLLLFRVALVGCLNAWRLVAKSIPDFLPCTQ